MKIKDIIYEMCYECDQIKLSYRADRGVFFFCNEQSKPITRKVLKECWEEKREHMLQCADCGLAFIADYPVCPECGSANLEEADSFDEFWGFADET